MISSIGMNREMNRLFSVFANRVQENASRAEADKASQNVIKGISWGNNNIDQLYPDSASRLEAVASGKVENPGKWWVLGVDVEKELEFKYSTLSENPTELAINWAEPSCLGIHLIGCVYDDYFQSLRRSYPEEYETLMQKRAERCDAVMKEYGLEGLSREEFYYKTHGELSKEMTDFFYQGFDDEGKRLISFFFPRIGEAFGF